MLIPVSQAAGLTVPGGPGPARAHPWATARPLRPVRVTHHRAPAWAASAEARSRQVPASTAPCPAISPGRSDRPSHAVAGIVRFTDPPPGWAGWTGGAAEGRPAVPLGS